MTVANIFPITRTINFTYTSTGTGSAGESLAAFKKGFTDMSFHEWRDMHQFVPAGWLADRYQPGIIHFAAVLGGAFDVSDSATVPTPGGTGAPAYQPGSLVITLYTDGTFTRSKTVKGFLFSLKGNASGGSLGGVQNYQYGFLMSGESNTDVPVTA